MLTQLTCRQITDRFTQSSNWCLHRAIHGAAGVAAAAYQLVCQVITSGGELLSDGA
jgi:hypothetical protein